MFYDVSHNSLGWCVGCLFKVKVATIVVKCDIPWYYLWNYVIIIIKRGGRVMELLQIVVLSTLLIIAALIGLAMIITFCIVLIPVGLVCWIIYGLYLLGRWLIKWIRKS